MRDKNNHYNKTKSYTQGKSIDPAIACLEIGMKALLNLHFMIKKTDPGRPLPSSNPHGDKLLQTEFLLGMYSLFWPKVIGIQTRS